MRVLISHSYFYFLDAKQWKTKKPFPPIGTLYAASLLRENGFEVVFFDNALQKNTVAFKNFLFRSNADAVVIYDDGFNYLTKMCLTNMRDAAFEMGRMAKELNLPAIICSSDSTDHYKMYLDNGFDFIIRGEGELTLLELLQHLKINQPDYSSVNGLAYTAQNEVKLTGSRPVLKNLDDLPKPAWDLIDIKPYREIWMKHHGFFSLNVSTTRGCPYKCNWCAKPIYGNAYNSRSPEKVVEEMSFLQDTFHVDEFWITDDIFGLKRNWVQEFAEESIKKGRKFRYRIQSRVDLMLRDNNLEAMVRSGMQEVWVGAESGSQKILDAMDKGITVEQIRMATENVRKYGKKICFFLQFGYMGENEEDIQKTIDLVLELMPDDIGISVSYPLPGTEFYEKVRSQLSQKTNWKDSDDLDLMYHGNFTKEFYRQLHRLVHKLYRDKQGRYLLNKPLSDWKNYGQPEFRSMLKSLLYYRPMSKVDHFRSRKLMKTSSL